MGTVGLSFGSPTSGAGFNVSQTVSEIVANLQNVETPWKSQLTTLDSQDTAISSLGTLVSNLSTDISSLTNFDGILAQKLGSSSNTNVLELTSASTSAIAGTHTVVVNNLAATSSGSLAEVANASDTLSGSVTLQVGTSGKSQAFNMADVKAAEGGTTLGDLASYINSSNVGIDASMLTDATGTRLSLVSGTSGAKGNIIATANSLTAAVSNTLSSSVMAGSSNETSTATLSPVSSSTETLTGTLSITVNGVAQTIYLGNSTDANAPAGALATGTSTNTLSSLETFINANASAFGLEGNNKGAAIVTNGDGTASLQLTSGTSGTAGTLAVNSSLVDSATSLAYTAAVTGENASLTVDGNNLTSASNTVSNLIPGVTFQLLSSSSAPVQIVIGNDNADVESTVNQFVSDYNSLMSAINTQDGNTSSGTPEPLFGSPTLSLLQEQILGSINTQNPSGYLDAIKSASDTLSGSISFSLAGGIPLYYSGTAGTDANATTGTSATTSVGTFSPIRNSGDTISGSISIQVGDGTATTVNVGDSSTPDTLAGLVTAISDAGIGVTAKVITNSDGSSSLSLTSGASGSAGSLTVTSSIADTSAQTVDVPSSDSTLAGLASAINSAFAGVTANVVTNSSGSQLEIMSNTEGTSGAVSVTTNLTDSTTDKALNYNNGNSDINSLTSLGISVNNDGTLAFSASSLDSLLNTDFKSVVGFFQNANSWGQTIASVLNNAGTSSSTGILKLASKSNSSIESSLNAEISKENMMISTEQASLTAELNSANEIMQQLPTELDGMNELYSAITGYNKGS